MKNRILPELLRLMLSAGGLFAAPVWLMADEPGGLPKLAQVHRGTPEIDHAILRHSGAPASDLRFFDRMRVAFGAEPLARFSELADFEPAARAAGRLLTGGPMLGVGENGGLVLWVRTARPAKVEVVVDGPDGPKTHGPVASLAETDLTAVVAIDGLPPGRDHAYRVLVDGRAVPVPESAVLRGPAVESGDKPVRLIFGADFHKSGLANRALLRTMASRRAEALLLLGDSAVDDRREWVGLHRSDYLLRDLSPGWQELAASTPVCAVWDDHDYFDNDLSGIPPGFHAVDRRRVRQVWQENWVNPGRLLGRDRGLEFRARMGPCDVILLDTRSQRGKPGEPQSFLGTEQTEWLLREIEACEGPYLILGGGTMWGDHISDGKDSWGPWDPETRERIFAALARKRLAVMLLSGDRHGARILRIPWGGGDGFWEFEMGSLGGHPGPAAYGRNRDQQVFGMVETPLFGEFEFHGGGTGSELVVRVLDAEGRERHAMKLAHGQLLPGPAGRD